MGSERSATHSSPNGVTEQLQQLSQREHHVLTHLVNRHPVSRDTNQAFQENLTFGQRIADHVASFGGSWPFIIIFLSIMLVWIVFNEESNRHFDPYPFILLNLALSCLAALQAPIIMMSQNRHAAKDRLAAQQDYEVNLKSELEILSLHAKMDELKDRQWMELIAQQERQLAILERIEAALANRGK